MTIRRLLLSTFILFAIASFNSPHVDADLVYAFNSHAADQNGHTLSGLITTTDASINDGYLVIGEIIDWEFSIAGASSTTVASTDAGASLQVSGDIFISATAITLEQPGVMSGFLNRIEMSSTDGSRALWHRDEFFGFFTDIYQGFSQNNNSWTNNAPSMSGTNPWLVATRVAAVPEPTTFTLFGIATSVSLFRRRRR